MKIIKVGMVGAGAIAEYHCAGINAHPQAEVVAVADPSAERARALAKGFGFKQVYSDAKDLLSNPDIDAVSIAVPNKLHAPLSKAALRAGKHVMLDKPFAFSHREAESVVEAAKKARRVIMLGMNFRYENETQSLKALIGRGELGDIYHAKAYWLRRSGIPKFGTWFCRKDMAGGGALLDIGVHMLDTCLYLLGNFKPLTVSAGAYTTFGSRGLGEGSWGMSDSGKHVFDVDDFGIAFIRLQGGITVELQASWAMHMADADRHNVEVFGSEAGASVFPLNLYRYGKKPGEYEISAPQGVRGPYSGTDRFGNWIDVILGRAKPCATMKEALAVQKILDAVYRSAKSRSEIRL